MKLSFSMCISRCSGCILYKTLRVHDTLLLSFVSFCRSKSSLENSILLFIPRH